MVAQGPGATPMRRLHLQRSTDQSGVSGTGRVAEGVVFDDGTVVLRWLGDVRSTVVFDNIAEVELIHGHGGDTAIVVDD